MNGPKFTISVYWKWRKAAKLSVNINKFASIVAVKQTNEYTRKYKHLKHQQ